MANVPSSLWSVQEVAAYLNVPVKTLYVWRQKKYGPESSRVGKHLRYQPEDVFEWVKLQKLAS